MPASASQQERVKIVQTEKAAVSTGHSSFGLLKEYGKDGPIAALTLTAILAYLLLR